MNQSSRVWVRRGGGGVIISVSQQADRAHSEDCDASDPDVAAFFEGITPGDREATFRQSDLDLIRALEDVVDALIKKEVLRLTDLPESVQQKLHSRRRMRGSIRSLNLLDAEED